MSIIQTVTLVTHDLGQFEVRRMLPSPALWMVGLFIFVDQFGPAQLDIGAGMSVRPHPHINLAIVTLLFEGTIDHRDSHGSFATIRPGQVNLMTAASGIVHSERSPQAERDAGPRLYGMQTWLALPDGREEIDPAFESRSDLQVIEGGGARHGHYGQPVGRERTNHPARRNDLCRDHARRGRCGADRGGGGRARSDAERRNPAPSL